MTLIPLPAFSDNYIWMLHDGQAAWVVDPGDAQPVLDALKTGGLRLQGILVTHHHPDHTGGVDLLREYTGAAVFGPARESVPEPLQRMHQGDRVQALGLQWEVIDVPGHTAGHIAFFCADVDGAPVLFCGDTLFSGGCGRLFEGTPAQMLDSLSKLAALPGNTRVCCTHEYTLSNLRFARAVEPANLALQNYQAHCEVVRAQGEPTLPSTMAMEWAINPFLRSTEPAIVASARAHDADMAAREGVFATLRAWKNTF